MRGGHGRGSVKLTYDVRGIVLYEVSKFRGVATVNDPTSVRSLVKLCLDFVTELICGTGLPVRPPMEGIQTDMRNIQQPGESCSQRSLLPRKAG